MIREGNIEYLGIWADGENEVAFLSSPAGHPYLDDHPEFFFVKTEEVDGVRFDVWRRAEA